MAFDDDNSKAKIQSGRWVKTQDTNFNSDLDLIQMSESADSGHAF